NSITFFPTTAPASGKIFADHATATDDSTDTISVDPGVPFGTVTLIPSPEALRADGNSTSQIISSPILDSDGNLVGLNRLFTVKIVPSNLGSITTPDASGLPGHQVATNLNSQLDFEFKAGTIGGSAVVSVFGGNASGDTTITIGSLSILSISTSPNFVSRGQSGIFVQMVVQNLSSSIITGLTSNANLTFTDAGLTDRTSEYTVQRTDGFDTIPAQGSRTLTFNVAVAQSATLDLITIDGQVSGFIGATPVSTQEAATKDSWTVQKPAQLIAISVTSPLDTVVVGQQGNTVTVRLSNPTTVDAASVVIDDIQLRFLENGLINKSSDFSFTPDGGNPTSIPASQQLDFRFTVGVGGSAISGDYEIDVAVTGHDTNSVNLILQDNDAISRHNWFVKDAPTFQILSITPSQSTFIAGDTTNKAVQMAIKNNGPDPIDLDFSPAKTYIRFIIGVDVTSEYTINQPTRLVNAGTNRLFSGATDTLAFVIDEVGTTTGKATITGRVEGIDVASGNPIVDDTNDGGTGVVDVASNVIQVRLTRTSPVTINSTLTGVGLVNTNQAFHIELEVTNLSSENLENVVVSLSSNGSSSFNNQETINTILKNDSKIQTFEVTASSTPNPEEVFTASILSARGAASGADATILPASDATAIVSTQTPAFLGVQFENLATAQTAGDTFQVQAKVVNLGQAEVDNSGQIRLNVPQNYTLLTDIKPAIQSFIVDNLVSWQVKAPDTPTVLDTFVVEIFQRPLDLNIAQFATIDAFTDTALISASGVVLNIDEFRIVSPSGATDNILSTQQKFILQTTISVSENIDAVEVELNLADGYSLDDGFANPVILNKGQNRALWRLQAPDNPHQTARPFEVNFRGFVQDTMRIDTTATLDVITVSRAFIDFQQFRVSNPAGAQTVSIGQQFQLSALVIKTGQAGIEGTAQLVLDLKDSGITTQDELRRVFTPGTQVIWNVTAPDTVTGPKVISVTLDSIPKDENTNDLADHNPQQLVRTVNIQTDTLGHVTLRSVSILSPSGAMDGTLSTDQLFTIEAVLDWNKAENILAEIVLPPDYQVFGGGSRFKPIDANGGDPSVNWTIIAPSVPKSLEFIKLNASARDVNNSSKTLVAKPDSLPFMVVEKAQLNFTAAITAPQSAIDRVLTVGQVFTVTAMLQNNGQAGVIGEDKIRITLHGGYSTREPLVKNIVPGNQITWQIKAPDTPSAEILDIEVEVVNEERNAVDENTSQLPPLSPVPAKITIPVTTQSIGLSATILSDRKPTTIVRGATSVPIFGLQFKNSSDANIEIKSMNINVKDKNGEELSPSSVLSRLAVVDYNNSSTIFSQVAPSTNPENLNFSPAIPIVPNQTKSIEFRVDIAPQTTAQNLQLSIDSPRTDILAINVEADTAVAILDSSGFEISNTLSPGSSVLIDANLEASFFNYPNPFGNSLAPDARPTTSFNYNLSQDSDVTIRIYTLLGELVKSYFFSATTAQGKAGTHSGEIIWDGTNDKGQKVLNGVYVAVLITNSGKAMTKIAIAK
ncbi:MAG: hypothetical protein ACE5HI_00790, partial [bacterium]